MWLGLYSAVPYKNDFLVLLLGRASAQTQQEVAIEDGWSPLCTPKGD
jgi:hypothetical protein